jgi:hypothetical protein
MVLKSVRRLTAAVNRSFVARTVKSSAAPDAKIGWSYVIFAMLAFQVITALSSTAIYYTTLYFGIGSVGNIAEVMQGSIGGKVEEHLLSRMTPITTYMSYMDKVVDELGIDVENFEQLYTLSPHQHAFLRSYFDGSRCCSAFFSNVRPVKGCHAIMDTNCSGLGVSGVVAQRDQGTDKALWSGVIHISDSYTQGYESSHKGGFAQASIIHLSTLS